MLRDLTTNSGGGNVAAGTTNLGDGDAHGSVDIQKENQLAAAEVPSQTVAQIIHLWRMRQRWHRAEKALTLQALAICRGQVREPSDGLKLSKAKLAKAQALFDAARKGEGKQGLRWALKPFLEALPIFEQHREMIEKRLTKVVRTLPVWPWVKGVKGFAELTLAAIVGESGGPNAPNAVGSYRGPQALWKRFGLGFVDGEPQRKDTKLGDLMGYSPERRSAAYLLGKWVRMAQVRVDKKTGEATAIGPYGAIYLDRLRHELARTDEGAAEYETHAKKRAVRKMSKIVLRDLWMQWRAAA
jgi:hypothetical protein